ncbi:MAG: TatD family hydrolase [Rickettsiales bacterium]|nr:TatD family hydrolase [Rickettsiales bacterium]
MIVDSHCHLNSPSLFENLNEVLDRAKDADVKIMQTICTKISEFEEIKKIAEENNEVFCSVGVHPNYIEKEEIVTVEKLVELTKNKKVIGLGETGLDYYHDHSKKELQKKSFLNHIEAAQITGIPLIIHAREVEKDMSEILTQQMAKKKFKAVLHCFTGSKKFAETALELGIYISISGIITFKNAKELQSTVQSLPLNRLLVETDAPYLAPVPFRGKTNEPAFTKFTVTALANLLNKTFNEVAKATTENFFAVFDKSYTNRT